MVKTCLSGRHTYSADRRMCPTCQKERHARWRNGHREHLREVRRLWRANNAVSNRESQRAYSTKHKEFRRLNEQRRRARISGGLIEPFSPSQWAEVVAFYSGLCAYCGERPWEHIEHVIPLALGGPHALRNLVPACAQCNGRKHVDVWEPQARHAYMGVF